MLAHDTRVAKRAIVEQVINLINLLSKLMCNDVTATIRCRCYTRLLQLNGNRKSV